MLRVLRGAILWIVILALALFLIFVEFVADVGGKAQPIRRPVNPPSGLAPTLPSSPAPDADTAIYHRIRNPYWSPAISSKTS